jgi:bifunctional DNA-binding transcriptional regulator/antitoxin component of YhaV-PrlF toxin-antitoxin module
LSSKRQVTLPLRVVDQLKLRPGEQLKVEAEGERVVLSRETSKVSARRAEIQRAAGSLPGVWKRGDLERLRAEWR